MLVCLIAAGSEKQQCIRGAYFTAYALSIVLMVLIVVARLVGGFAGSRGAKGWTANGQRGLPLELLLLALQTP